jgi:hypothetical protein
VHDGFHGTGDHRGRRPCSSAPAGSVARCAGSSAMTGRLPGRAWRRRSSVGVEGGRVRPRIVSRPECRGTKGPRLSRFSRPPTPRAGGFGAEPRCASDGDPYGVTGSRACERRRGIPDARRAVTHMGSPDVARRDGGVALGVQARTDAGPGPSPRTPPHGRPRARAPRTTPLSLPTNSVPQHPQRPRWGPPTRAPVGLRSSRVGGALRWLVGNDREVAGRCVASPGVRRRRGGRVRPRIETLVRW